MLPNLLPQRRLPRKTLIQTDALTIEEDDEDDETTEQKEDTLQQVMILLLDVSNNLEFCILHS
jgi:hypothetical protein